MVNTFTSRHYHVIFSTKNREPWIRQDIEQRVRSYLGGIVRENGMKALLVGGIENHLHLLLGIPAALSLSKALQFIKGGFVGLDEGELPGHGGIRMARRIHRVHCEAFLDKHEIDYKEEYVLG